MRSKTGITYRHHVAAIAKLGTDERARILARLLRGCPETTWPDGMPCSLDPKLVLIGVSPGNSPGNSSSCVRYVGELSTSIDTTSNFYYPDARRYWDKVRYLASAFVSHHDRTVSETDALLVTSHFNLGVGSAWTATTAAVEEPYVRWVSGLLNNVLKPDLVVLFGLGSILKDKFNIVIFFCTDCSIFCPHPKSFTQEKFFWIGFKYSFFPFF